MPTMANITVKKADGTTDIVYTALTPSAGDKVAAQWRVESIGVVAGNRPVFQVMTRASQDKGARIIEGKLVYPETFTDSTTGLISTKNRELFSFSAITHMNASDSAIAELAAQAANLVKSILIQDVLKTGYAPT
jgi:hypothetical protein